MTIRASEVNECNRWVEVNVTREPATSIYLNIYLVQAFTISGRCYLPNWTSKPAQLVGSPRRAHIAHYTPPTVTKELLEDSIVRPATTGLTRFFETAHTKSTRQPLHPQTQQARRTTAAIESYIKAFVREAWGGALPYVQYCCTCYREKHNRLDAARTG